MGTTIRQNAYQQYNNTTRVLNQSEIDRIIEFLMLTGAPIPDDIKRMLGISILGNTKVPQQKRPKKRLKI